MNSNINAVLITSAILPLIDTSGFFTILYVSTTELTINAPIPKQIIIAKMELEKITNISKYSMITS